MQMNVVKKALAEALVRSVWCTVAESMVIFFSSLLSSKFINNCIYYSLSVS